jgi:transaldolase
MTDSIARLRAAGVPVWLDDLSRERLTAGSLAALRDRGVSGVTTNPTIFARAISDSDAYAGQIRDLKLRQVPVDQTLRELTASDVRQACDVLRPVYEATSGVDGRVSIEVDPRIAHDTGRTVAEARALWWLVDRPNLFIKIPARQGLAAITACLAEGISINVMLIFSLARYAEVIEAFRQRRAVAFGCTAVVIDGHNITQIDQVLTAARDAARPTVILSRTVKGKIFAEIEDKNGWHGRPLPPDMAQRAVSALGGELMEAAGISASRIAAAARELLND